jgi:uncharacterized damage-inducible protein DinB
MKAQLLSTIENSRAYTLAIAEAMPEDRLNFRPAPTVWSFLELMNHIAYGVVWWTENCILKVKTPWDPPASYKTKADTRKSLQQSFDYLNEVLNAADLDDETIHGVFATLDHITHHRGQATTYLRCNGITPAEYIF